MPDHRLVLSPSQAARLAPALPTLTRRWIVVSPDDLLTDAFISRRTGFPHFESMAQQSPVRPAPTRAAGWDSIPAGDSNWNGFFHGATPFADWQSLVRAAKVEFARRTLASAQLPSSSSVAGSAPSASKASADDQTASSIQFVGAEEPVRTYDAEGRVHPEKGQANKSLSGASERQRQIDQLLHDVGGPASLEARVRAQARARMRAELAGSTQLTLDAAETLLPNSEEELAASLVFGLLPIGELSVVGGKLSLKLGKKVYALSEDVVKVLRKRFGGWRGLRSIPGNAARAFELSRKFKPGAGTLVRNDKLLAENIGYIPEGFTAHHLLAISSANGSKLMRIGAKRGYDINRASNGMVLPNAYARAIETGLPLHSKGGTHIKEYFSRCKSLLEDLEKAFPDFLDEEFQPTPERLQAFETAIAEVEDTLRNELSQGLLHLQRYDPFFK